MHRVDDGLKRNMTSAEQSERRESRKRDRLLEQENQVLGCVTTSVTKTCNSPHPFD